jgi:mRNA-degrading endonuclease RelE of RelBE toxin-antitoxin system
MDCRLVEKLNHPSIAGNEKFWEEFSKISKNDDRALEALIKKHAPEEIASKPKVRPGSDRPNFSLNKKAEKAVQKLNPQNQKHFDEFIQVVNEKGIQGLYEQPKKWHFEKLRMNSNLHTVRLDKEYRVLFEINDGVVNILDMGIHVTH